MIDYIFNRVNKEERLFATFQNLEAFSKDIKLQAQEKTQEMETTPQPWRRLVGRLWK